MEKCEGFYSRVLFTCVRPSNIGSNPVPGLRRPPPVVCDLVSILDGAGPLDFGAVKVLSGLRVRGPCTYVIVIFDAGGVYAMRPTFPRSRAIATWIRHGVP